MGYWDGRVGTMPPLSTDEVEKAKQQYPVFEAAMSEILESARYRAGQAGDAVTFERLGRLIETYDHHTACRVAAAAVLQLAAQAVEVR